MELPWSSPGFVNVYFIEEKDGYVMIDCGVNGSEYQELLETKMKSFGLSYENIKLLIGTHMQSDHIGLSSTLREKDIPFALYKNSVEFIEGYNDWSIRFKKLKEYAKKEGAPKSFLNDIEQIETPTYAGKISKPDVLLEEGNIKKVQIYPKKSKAMNLAFDVTPAKYVTGLITEKGICEASESGLKKLFK